MSTLNSLLAEARRQVHEVEPTEVQAQSGDSVFLDVREAEEYSQGAIGGAVDVPRGRLELDVETRIPDKEARVVVYCAAGVRSVFAARTLAELGYTNVASMAGGFNRWKDEGRPWSTPQVLSAERRNRYQRHLLLPEIGMSGQLKLLESKVLVLGAGGSARRRRSTSPPPGSARSVSSTTPSSTCRISSVRSSTTAAGSASARLTPRRRR